MKFKSRPWTIEDIDSLIKYADNLNIAKNFTDFFPHPYTIENGQTFIERAANAHPISVFPIAVNGEAVGAIGIHP